MKSSRALAVLSCVSILLGLASVSPATGAQRFKDVPTSHVFAVQIAWLADQGITTGYADGTFKPGAPVLREQMAAFLYRLAGQPEVSQVHMPYSDVPANHPFRKAIAWMSTLRITTGYTEANGELTFRPSQPVLREQMAAFLHRLAAKPDQAQLPGTSPFADVPTSHTFYSPIVWLAGTGISTGYVEGGSTSYRGSQPVLREQMAAFLYRYTDLLESDGIFDVSTVSVQPDGDISRDKSWGGVVSDDGRYVAYTGDSQNFGSDGHHLPRVYLTDRATGDIVESPDSFPVGTPYAGLTFDRIEHPVIAGDGGVVLVTGTVIGTFETVTYGLIWDVENGELDVVPGMYSSLSDVSDDGSVVTMIARRDPETGAPFYDGRSRLVVWDRAADTFEYPIVAADGNDPDGEVWEAERSSDGRYLAFTSNATNLVGGATGGGSRVYLRDRDAEGGPTIRQVSIVPPGTDLNFFSDHGIDVADDGTVVYESRVPVPEIGDDSHNPDIRVWDPVTGETTLASWDADDNWSTSASISADGRYVSFATRVDPRAGLSGLSSAVVWETQSDTLDVVSRDYWGGVPSAGSESPSISGDGSTVVFHSGATDLVPFDLLGYQDVYAWDRPEGG